MQFGWASPTVIGRGGRNVNFLAACRRQLVWHNAHLPCSLSEHLRSFFICYYFFSAWLRPSCSSCSVLVFVSWFFRRSTGSLAVSYQLKFIVFFFHDVCMQISTCAIYAHVGGPTCSNVLNSPVWYIRMPAWLKWFFMRKAKPKTVIQVRTFFASHFISKIFDVR